MGILNKAADVAQKGAVVGLLSLLGYQVFQIGYNVTEKLGESKNQHVEVMKQINEKVKEESKDKNSVDKIPDRYDPDDNSYLKKVPKFN